MRGRNRVNKEELVAVWTVKGGQQGEREERLLQNGLIGGGWAKLPSLASVGSREALVDLYATTYPDASPATRGNYVGQLWSLVSRMQVGELVVLPLKTTGTIAVGEIAGAYEYRTDLGEDLTHVRPVKWLKTDLARDFFDQDLLYSFGAFLTFGRVQRENAELRIRKVLAGHPEGGAAGQSRADEEPIAESAPDIRMLAREQIRERIGRKFSGHGLARLVGDVLTGMGYVVNVSPPGADGGVDLLAGSGPMGLESPRLAVQVKTGNVGVDEFRALSGILDNFDAEQGLLVAWGGFRGTVRAEARHSYFRVRLWDADDLLDQLFEVYPQLPEEFRSELPLKPVFALVSPDE